MRQKTANPSPNRVSRSQGQPVASNDDGPSRRHRLRPVHNGSNLLTVMDDTERVPDVVRLNAELPESAEIRVSSALPGSSAFKICAEHWEKHVGLS